MRFRTSTVLLGLVLILGGYAWVFELNKPPAPEEERDAFSVRADEVRKLAVRHGDVHLRFEREDGGWRMTEPMKIRANASMLRDLLNDLEHLEISQHLKDAKPGPAFGLEPPAASLTFSKDGGEEQGLLVGDDSPDGATAYASRAGRREVILIPRAFGARLRKGMNDFRDHALIAMSKDRVVRLSLIYPDRTLSVARKGAGWRLEEPFDAAAGGDETGRALDSFYAVVADTFVSDDIKDFAPYGLDKPRLEVRVWDRPQGEPSGLAIGAKARERQMFETQDTFYARPLGTSSVMTVKIARVDDLVKEPKHFHAWRLLEGAWDAVKRVELEGPNGKISAEHVQPEGWQAREPYPGTLNAALWNERVANPLKALQPSGMEPVTEKRLKQLGFDHPLGHITLVKDGDARQVLTLGSVDAKTHEAYLTLESDGFIFTVGEGLKDLLSLRYADLRSLALLSLPLAGIQGLEWARPDGDLVFESPAKGAWNQTKPEKREGPLPGVNALAATLTTLNAECWVAFGKLPWKDYGLDPPAATLRITCAEGSQPARTRVLEMGRRDPKTGAVYGRLDHDDEVMALSPRLLDLVLGDPGKAPSP